MLRPLTFLFLQNQSEWPSSDWLGGSFGSEHWGLCSARLAVPGITKPGSHNIFIHSSLTSIFRCFQSLTYLIGVSKDVCILSLNLRKICGFIWHSGQLSRWHRVWNFRLKQTRSLKKLMPSETNVQSTSDLWATVIFICESAYTLLLVSAF